MYTTERSTYSVYSNLVINLEQNLMIFRFKGPAYVYIDSTSNFCDPKDALLETVYSSFLKNPDAVNFILIYAECF